MTIRAPFKPHYGTNQVITPAAGAAAVTINGADKSVRVCNTGAAIGYFRLYSSANTAEVATVADCPVPSGVSLVIEKPEGFDKMSTISATGTTFQVMTGEGGC